MKVNPITVKINDLIDEHNQVSAYGSCPGCDLCIEIERISKAAGLWINEEKLQAIEKMRINKIRSAQLPKEELERLIKAGLTNKEISKKLGLTEKIIGHKIRTFFPDINRRKKRNELAISLDQYKEMRDMFHNVVDIHTSGHADRATIKKVIETINPNEVICIHKEADAEL